MNKLRKIVAIFSILCLFTSSNAALAEEMSVSISTVVDGNVIVSDSVTTETTVEPTTEPTESPAESTADAGTDSVTNDNTNVEQSDDSSETPSITGDNVETILDGYIYLGDKSIEYYDSENLSNTYTDRFIVKDSNGVRFIKTDQEENALEYITNLKNSDPTIIYVQPDYQLQLASLSNQWALENSETVKVAEISDEEYSNINQVKDTLSYSDWSIDVDGTEALEYATGLNTVVAVIDTGMDTSHEQLSSAIFQNENEISGNEVDDDSNGYIDDICGWDFVNDINSVYTEETKYDSWHATAVAGIISATAPNTKVLPLKVFEDGSAYTSDIIRAIEYCEKMNIKIANCSWTGSEENLLLKETMLNSDILFVCAAGNKGQDLASNPLYPACYDLDNVITVSSVNSGGFLSNFSNYNDSIADIAAPGEDIESISYDNKYGTMSGTSLSAAFVSAAAALLCEQSETSSAKDIKSILTDTAVKLYSLDGKTYNGNMLNCLNAVTDTVAEKAIYINYSYEAAEASATAFSANSSISLFSVAETSSTEEEYADWTQSATMTEGRYNMASVSVDNKIYIFGGMINGQPVDSYEIYDTVTNTSNVFLEMPWARYKHSAVYGDGKIYICGGYDMDGQAISDIWVYNVASNTWETSIAVPNNITNYMAGYYNNSLYILGGKKSNVSTTDVYSYSTLNQTWEQKASIGMTIVDGTALYENEYFYLLTELEVLSYSPLNNYCTTDGCIENKYDYAAIMRTVGAYSQPYVSGGWDYRGISSSVGYKYESASYNEELWLNDKSLPYALEKHNMVICNGYMYILGGVLSDGSDSNKILKKSLTADIDDYNKNETVYITIGDTVTGSCNSATDIDTFYFTPDVSGKYKILDLSDSSSKYFNMYVDLKKDGTTICADIPDYVGEIYLESGQEYSISISDACVESGGNYSFEIVDSTEEIMLNEARGKHNIVTVNNELYAVGGIDMSTGSYVDSIEKFDAENNCWNVVATISNPKSGVTVTSSGSKIYLIGGYKNGVYTNTIDVYDTASNTWTYIGHLIQERERAAAFVLNNSLYVLGGRNSKGYLNDIEIYNLQTNKVDNVLTTLPQAMMDMSAFYLSGRIYLVGGYGYTGYLKKVYEYNLQDNTYTEKADIPVSLKCMQAVKYGGDILVVGSKTQYGVYYVQMLSYNITNNAWQEKSIITHTLSSDGGLMYYDIGILNNYLYTIGGCDNKRSYPYIYSYALGTSSAEPSFTEYGLLTARAKGAFAEVNGEMYIVGGINQSGVVKSIEKYNSTTNVWEYVTDVPHSRRGYSVVSSGNKIYILGGYADGVYFNTVNVYNVSTKIWSTIANMPTERERICSIVANGKIFTFGGRNENGVLNCVEIYNISSNTWGIGTDEMDKPKMDGEAVLIDDSIYVVGGFDGDDYSTSVFVYDSLDTNGTSSNKQLPRTSGYIKAIVLDKYICVLNKDVYSNVTNMYANKQGFTAEWGEVDMDVPQILNYSTVGMYNGYLYVIGGYDNETNTYSNELAKYEIKAEDIGIKEEVTENTLSVNIENGQEYPIAVSVSEATNLSGKTFTLTYDPLCCDVVDLCALTYIKELSTGSIQDTDIKVISVSSGEIKFTVDKEIDTGMRFSGVINIIKFKTKADGDCAFKVTVS